MLAFYRRPHVCPESEEGVRHSQAGGREGHVHGGRQSARGRV